MNIFRLVPKSFASFLNRNASICNMPAQIFVRLRRECALTHRGFPWVGITWEFRGEPALKSIGWVTSDIISHAPNSVIIFQEYHSIHQAYLATSRQQSCNSSSSLESRHPMALLSFHCYRMLLFDTACLSSSAWISTRPCDILSHFRHCFTTFEAQSEGLQALRLAPETTLVHHVCKRLLRLNYITFALSCSSHSIWREHQRRDK